MTKEKAESIELKLEKKILSLETVTEYKELNLRQLEDCFFVLLLFVVFIKDSFDKELTQYFGFDIL